MRGVPTRRVLATILSLALLGVLAAPAAGQEDLPSDPFERLQELQKRIDAAKAQQSDLIPQIEASDKRRQELDVVVTDLDKQAAGLKVELDSAQKELDATTRSLAEAQQRTEEAAKRLAATRERVQRRVVALYKDGPTAFVDAVLATERVNDVPLRVEYVRSIVESDRSLADVTRVAEADYRDLAERLDRLRQRQADARDKVAAAKKVVDDKLSEKKQALDTVTEEVELKKSILTKIEADRASYEELLAKERDDILRVTALLVGRGGTPPPGVIAGLFSLPVIGAVVSPFGYRVHPIYGTVRLHAGVDLDASYGDPIHAAANGVVAETGWMGGYGNAVIIDHGSGLATLYAHQSQIAVSEGQEVTRGEVIGYVGSTGLSTGPHLHFEVRVGGEPTDPLPWLGVT